MLIEHRPRHLNQRPILPLYNSILLWSVGRRILVFEPLITSKGVKSTLLEVNHCQESQTRGARELSTRKSIC